MSLAKKPKQKQYCTKFNKDFNNGVHHKKLKKKKKDSLGDSNAEGAQAYLEKAYSYFMPGPVWDLQIRCVIGTDQYAQQDQTVPP